MRLWGGGGAIAVNLLRQFPLQCGVMRSLWMARVGSLPMVHPDIFRLQTKGQGVTAEAVDNGIERKVER